MKDTPYLPVTRAVCAECQGSKDMVGQLCSQCIEKNIHSAKMAKRRKQADLTLCSCGRPRDTERFMTCTACRDTVKKSAAMFRERCRQNNVCSQCGKEPSPNGKECGKCAESRRNYRKENIERQKLWHRNYNQNNRKLVVAAYGGKCACCGESDYRFLTIDHINGDGAAHSKQIKQSLTSWLKANNYPQEGFQCLCYNCNCAKWLYGECPHKIPLAGLTANVTR